MSDAKLSNILGLIQLVINKVPRSMVTLGLEIAVLDLSLTLFIKSELSNSKVIPLINSEVFGLYYIFLSFETSI